MNLLTELESLGHKLSLNLGRLLAEHTWAYALVGMAGGGLFLVAVSLLEPLKALVAILGAVLAVVILMRPEIGMILMIATIPLDRLGRLTSFQATVHFSVAKILGILTFVGWGLRYLIKKEKVVFSSTMLPLLIFFLYACVTLIYSTNRELTLQAILRYLTTIYFLFLLLNMMKSKNIIELVITFFLLATLFIGIFSLGMRYFPSYLTMEGEDTIGVMVDFAEESRVGVVQSSQGTTVHPGFYVIHLLIVIPLYIFMFLDSTSLALKFLWGISGCIAAMNLFLTQRRAGIVTLIVMIVIMLWKKLIRLTPRAIIFSGITLLGIFLLMPGTFLPRVFSVSAYKAEESFNVEARIKLLQAGWEMLKDYWLWGVGLFNTTELPKYTDLNISESGWTVHNGFLQLWIEVGIFGLCIFIYLLYIFWRTFTNAEKNFFQAGDSRMHNMTGFLKVAFLVPMILAPAGVDFNIPMRDWWFICGLAMVLDKLSQSETGVISSRSSFPKNAKNITAPQP